MSKARCYLCRLPRVKAEGDVVSWFMMTMPHETPAGIVEASVCCVSVDGIVYQLDRVLGGGRSLMFDVQDGSFVLMELR